MEAKQHFSGIKKDGKAARHERLTADQQAELSLKKIKENSGEMVLIAISKRTTIELPAHLTQAERDIRIANYIKMRESKNNSLI